MEGARIRSSVVYPLAECLAIEMIVGGKDDADHKLTHQWQLSFAMFDVFL